MRRDIVKGSRRALLPPPTALGQRQRHAGPPPREALRTAQVVMATRDNVVRATI